MLFAKLPHIHNSTTEIRPMFYFFFYNKTSKEQKNVKLVNENAGNIKLNSGKKCHYNKYSFSASLLHSLYYFLNLKHSLHKQ